MNVPARVLVIAEGPSEIGDLDALTGGGRRGSRRREGYLPPMLRKLLGNDIEIDAQRITLLPTLEAKRRLKGHADRAAKALRFAETQGYAILVFVKDVDRQSATKKSDLERKRKLEEITEEVEAGFADVVDAQDVQRVIATPCRMIEAWALGDLAAIARVRAKRTASDEPAALRRPETLWGDEEDPTSSHPKCVLARVLGKQVSASIFEELALESEPAVLEKSCPESFGPFAKSARRARSALSGRE